MTKQTTIVVIGALRVNFDRVYEYEVRVDRKGSKSKYFMKVTFHVP